MESFAFPDEIDELKIDEYFLAPQNSTKAQQAECLSSGKNTLFHFDCYPGGNAPIKKSST